MKPQNKKLAIAAAIGDTDEVARLIKAGVVVTEEASYVSEYNKFSYSAAYQSFVENRDVELCKTFLDEEDVQKGLEPLPKFSSMPICMKLHSMVVWTC